MKDPFTNRLAMIGACIATAERPEYSPIWTGQPPLDFGVDLAALKTAYNTTTAAASAAYAATTGPADAKAQAETALEDAAFVLARACFAHFSKTGDATRRAQVNFTRSAIQRLREQALLSTATLIRDIGNIARDETGAVGRGVTLARVSALTTAITNFNNLLNTPRSQIANRSVLIRDVETRVADLVAKAEALDDLVLQFDGTPAGRAFGAAWQQARIIIDAGHGPGEEAGGGAPPAPTA
jgi:hypothetical protein